MNLSATILFEMPTPRSRAEKLIYKFTLISHLLSLEFYDYIIAQKHRPTEYRGSKIVK